MKEVIMLATQNDVPTMRITVPLIIKNLKPDRIVVISNVSNKQQIESLDGVCFFDEDNVIKGLSLGRVKEILQELGGPVNRAGWYLQQFLKLGWAYHSVYDDYICVDSDTMILDNISYIMNGKYLFTEKIEHHEPYFRTINKLFDNKITTTNKYSFIAEQMIFNSEIVKQMLDQINSNDKIYGNSFYEKILRCIDLKDMNAGFSEFETYGSYMLTYHPDLFEMRKLKTFRNGAEVLGTINEDVLNWASSSFQIVSLEKNLKMGGRVILFHWLTSKRIIRFLISMKNIVKAYILVIKLSDILHRRKTLIYEKI